MPLTQPAKSFQALSQMVQQKMKSLRLLWLMRLTRRFVDRDAARSLLCGFVGLMCAACITTTRLEPVEVQGPGSLEQKIARADDVVRSVDRIRDAVRKAVLNVPDSELARLQLRRDYRIPIVDGKQQREAASVTITVLLENPSDAYGEAIVRETVRIVSAEINR